MKKDYVAYDRLDLKKLCDEIDAMSEEDIAQYIKEYEENAFHEKYRIDERLNTNVLDGSEEEQELQLKLWLGLSPDQSFADLPDIPEDLDEPEN